MLPLNVIPQEFMCDNRVLAVYDRRIITALVEHSHIYAENIGKIYGAVHSALIRAYDHKVLFVHKKIRLGSEKRLHKLIRGIEAVKSVKRDGILYPGVVCVEGNNVVDAHIYQFLEGKGTV